MKALHLILAGTLASAMLIGTGASAQTQATAASEQATAADGAMQTPEQKKAMKRNTKKNGQPKTKVYNEPQGAVPRDVVSGETNAGTTGSENVMTKPKK